METTAHLIEVMFAFSRNMKEKMSVKSDFAHFSVVQLQTLVFLEQKKTSPMKHIADYLQIELPSATNLVDKLVKTGLVVRSVDAKDKRVVNISLTKKGKELLAKAKAKRRLAIEKILTSLSETEKKQLLQILIKMVDTMERSYEK